MPSKVDFHELQSAAITSGLDREALLSGIDRRITASLTRLPSRAAQILRDLYELDEMGTRPDGSNPLRTWLRNAATLSAPRQEEKVFRRALALLEPEVTAMTTPPVAPREARSAAPSMGFIYISASRSDDAYVERFAKLLVPLTRQGFKIFARKWITAGDDFRKVASKNLDAATLFVPLLSADYLAETETYEELNQALKRPGLRVVPVFLRPCSWSLSPELKKLGVTPKKAVTSHSDVESAIQGVVEVLQNILTPPTGSSAGDSSSQDEVDEAPPPPPKPVSLYDEEVYPWSNKHARELHEQLMIAYPSLEELTNIANKAAVNLRRFEPGKGAIEPAWTSLLNVATKQGQLKALFDAVLSDNGATRQHAKIQAALALLGVK